MNKTHISNLDYHLPKSSIAQDPYKNPEDSRILNSETMTIHKFENIDNVVPYRSLLVFNNSQVIDVRVKTIKKHTHGSVEIFILRIVDEYSADCLLKFNGKKKVGDQIELDKFSINIIKNLNEGFRLKFSLPLEQIINNYGTTPLPPYIEDMDYKYEHYKTFFSENGFSVAASTAALHFTPYLFQKLKVKEIDIKFLNLDIGLGTFKPISTEYVEDYDIHSEDYEIKEETYHEIINKKRMGYNIVCVGTTTLRTLEHVYKTSKFKGKTDLFITNRFKFNVADYLITNFHAPKSSLLSIVQAIYGDSWKKLYEFALENNMKFLSFGDAVMFKIKNNGI